MTITAPEELAHNPEGPTAIALRATESLGSGSADELHRYNTTDVPLLRALGLALLTACVGVHKVWIDHLLAWPAVGRFALVSCVYVLISSVLLRTLHARLRRVDLGALFLTLDVALWIYALYLTGAERSWLVWLLLIRVADQSSTSLRRVLWFAHVSMVSYGLLLLWVAWVEDRPIVWSTEIAKLGLLYASNLYLAVSARTAQKLRRRLRNVVKVARELVGKLSARTRELEAAHRRADDAGDAKSNVVAQVSHEIRTPLTGIIGTLDLALETDNLAKEQRDYMTAARDAAQSLIGLLNDILDLSKLEADRLELESTSFEPRAFVQSTLRPLLFQARKKGIELSSRVTELVPQRLIGDPGRFSQVLLNLAGNAVKFTDEGSVQVSIDCAQNNGTTAVLVVTVADTGIGIAADKLADVFVPFTQADPTISRKYGGTGLGLAIAEQLVQRMNGLMHVESEVGVGSRFSFTATFQIDPILNPQAKPRAPEISSEQLGPLHVLVADDDPLNRAVSLRILQRAGHTVVSVDNGRKALDLLAAHRFDVVLMDVQMPELDGLEATRAFRAREAAGQHVPIVGLTAGSAASDEARCKAAGMDLYLAKPLTPAALFQTLHRLFGVPAPKPTSQPTAPSPRPPPRRQTMLERIGGDVELLNELMALFALELPTLLRDLRAKIVECKTEEIERAAHKLRGALLGVDATSAATIAGQIESLAREERLEPIFMSLTALDEEVRLLLDEQSEG